MPELDNNPIFAPSGAPTDVKTRKQNTRTSKGSDGLERSGKFCGGIRNDLKRRIPHYASDWTDGFKSIKVVTAALYMFCGCLAPGIAFGASMDIWTGGEIGVVEYLVTQSVSGIIFAIICGQPLVILRPTGPITLFLTELFTLSKTLGVPFLTLQAWVGLFVGFYMIMVAVTDTCALIRFCSRFTQDLFGCFVSVIFISMGFSNIALKFAGVWGLGSSLMMLLLTLGTVYTALTLAGAGNTPYLMKQARDVIADFAVPLAIVIFALIGIGSGVDMELLPVPDEFAPTREGRSWGVELLPQGVPGWLPPLVGAIGALPLSLLFFVDQNVTSLLTQHPDHKLKKGAAFHWNFFILGVFNMVFPLFGCPYVTGSLPHSPQFVKALATMKVEQGKLVVDSVSENRVSPLLVNVLVLLSLLIMLPMLATIPTAVVCDGLFLFMGLSGLPGNELWERLKMVFMQKDLRPQLHFSEEEVPWTQVHTFTLFQLGCVGMLYGVSKSPIALLFPVFLIATIPICMLLPLLSCGILSKTHVAHLDHRQPPAQLASHQAAPEDIETSSTKQAPTPQVRYSLNNNADGSAPVET